MQHAKLTDFNIKDLCDIVTIHKHFALRGDFLQSFQFSSINFLIFHTFLLAATNPLKYDKQTLYLNPVRYMPFYIYQLLQHQ